MDILHVEIQIGLRREDSVADGAVGDTPVDAHVVMERVLVGVALLADLTTELLGPAPRCSAI